MAVLGFHHFLLLPYPIQFLSPKLRICVVLIFSVLSKSFLLLTLIIFGNPQLWEIFLEFLTSEIISFSAYSCLNSSSFLRSKKFLIKIARRKSLVELSLVARRLRLQSPSRCILLKESVITYTHEIPQTKCLALENSLNMEFYKKTYSQSMQQSGVHFFIVSIFLCSTMY